MGREIATLLEKDVRIVNRRRSGLIITHTGYILITSMPTRVM